MATDRVTSPTPTNRPPTSAEWLTRLLNSLALTAGAWDTQADVIEAKKDGLLPNRAGQAQAELVNVSARLMRSCAAELRDTIDDYSRGRPVEEPGPQSELVPTSINPACAVELRRIAEMVMPMQAMVLRDIAGRIEESLVRVVPQKDSPAARHALVRAIMGFLEGSEVALESVEDWSPDWHLDPQERAMLATGLADALLGTGSVIVPLDQRNILRVVPPPAPSESTEPSIANEALDLLWQVERFAADRLRRGYQQMSHMEPDEYDWRWKQIRDAAIAGRGALLRVPPPAGDPK